MTPRHESQCWRYIEVGMSNFQPLDVVCSGSETQLQVGENLNKLP